MKSAILLAGLFARGETTVREPEATRDHTERMLGAMGATVARDGKVVRVSPLQAPLRPLTLNVPGDISSAAFPLVAAAIVPESDICLDNIGINPTRTGLLDVFDMMGLRLELGEADQAGEHGDGQAIRKVEGKQVVVIPIDANPPLAAGLFLLVVRQRSFSERPGWPVRTE